MSTVQRRRAAAALVCALACGILVQRQAGEAERAAGPQRPVLVARSEIERGTVFAARPAQFEQRQIPRSLVPAGAIADPATLAGAELAVVLPAGAIVAQAYLAAAGGPARSLGVGERLIALAVRSNGDEPPVAGARVDVIAAGEQGVAELMLEGAEVALVGDAEHVTLRVTLRQAVRLLAARAAGADFVLFERPSRDRRTFGQLIERAPAE